jgi:outer membrane protein
MKTSVGLGLIGLMLFAPGIANAETLYDAFKTAFVSNEVLAAQRAAVRIAEQDKVLALTGFAPAVSGVADTGYENLKGQTPDTSTTQSITRPRGYGVTLNQNVWNGFKTFNSVARESASIQAERHKLRDVEQKILTDVATVYVDVIRDKSILELRRSDYEVLSERAKQTRFRFKIGEVTRTDVDQSDASLARSNADLTIAKANLETSIAAFRSVVGRDPGKLEPAAVPERLLPPDLNSALSVAQAEHPAIQSAMDTARAAEININVERAGYAPSIDLQASAQHRWDPDYYPTKTDLTSVAVVGRLTIPLFDRGVTFASVGRATEVASERTLELDHQRVQIRADVVRNDEIFLASKMIIASANAQIEANQRALTGVEIEASAGQRTTYDILTAQRAFVDSRVNLQIAQHDRIISGYRLLASIGRLSLASLTPNDTRGADIKPPVMHRTTNTIAPVTIDSIAALPLRRTF